ncbi:tetratricopeptide repeat protein [Maricaulis sp. D1M11]|uniref:tetratricopeptide repeat protein n=1 Tax=Maricaulis sp. D1M11 TaxID=3076117 RepID=UPI0039B37F81
MLHSAMSLLTLSVSLVVSSPATGQVRGVIDAAIREETARYQACLEAVPRTPSDAYEDALSWRMEGGGWPALHCEARALKQLGSPTSAAAALSHLASSSLSIEDSVRAQLALEAGEMWMDLSRAEAARDSFQAGLDFEPDHPDLLLGLAHAQENTGDWSELNAVASRLVTRVPGYAEAWRLRGRARLELGDIGGAEADMHQARQLDPALITALVLRGQINEARRTEPGAR